VPDETRTQRLRAGDPIPNQTSVVDERQLFLYSAATYNPHRIHYDRTWATTVEGYPDLLVHGPLQAALLVKAVTDWMGPDGQLVRVGFQNRSTAHPGELLTFGGTVREAVADGDDVTVELELTATKNGGEVLVPATAFVRLPAGAERAG
jgi:hydroxyacyl-ACP dehydratase HTD2-like protein with hotdog domain